MPVWVYCANNEIRDPRRRLQILLYDDDEEEPDNPCPKGYRVVRRVRHDDEEYY